MAGDKRKVQEINAGSMADIAFLLLIFFLVATTMNTDTGLTRVLPPMPDPNQKQEDVKVKYATFSWYSFRKVTTSWRAASKWTSTS